MTGPVAELAAPGAERGHFCHSGWGQEEVAVRTWWGERTPYVTLVAAVLGLAALLGANAALAGTAEGSVGPPWVVSEGDEGGGKAHAPARHRSDPHVATALHWLLSRQPNLLCI